MRTRWVLAVGVAVVGVSLAYAQPAPLPTGPAIPTAPAVPGSPPIPPAAPPLLPVPAQPVPPLAVVPRPGTAPGIEYDPGYLYLPDQVPERRRAADVCGPLGRWWVDTSLELAWVPTQSAPANIRLRIADPTSPGGTLPGPIVPVAGRSSGAFDAAMNLAVGHWFDEGNTRGVDASFFFRDASNTFFGVAPGAVVVFPRGHGRGAPQVIAYPNPFGVVSTFPVTLETFFATVDVNYRQRLYCSENARLDGLVGYRYAFLGDELYLGESADDNDYRQNRAAVSNSFHGGQVGLAGEVRMNGWYVSGSAKIALGSMTSNVKTSGLFYGAEGRSGNSFRTLGGLTSAEQTQFAVMPTFNVQVGRQITPHIRLFTGYSFAYLSRVSRLGDALSPGNAGLSTTDFWVQSISLGAEFRF
jgi:hypothetical protein